jgi:hypothetical protein
VERRDLRRHGGDVDRDDAAERCANDPAIRRDRSQRERNRLADQRNRPVCFRRRPVSGACPDIRPSNRRCATRISTVSVFPASTFLPTLNPIEPPWYGPVCPVVWEGWRREVSPYPDPWESQDPLSRRPMVGIGTPLQFPRATARSSLFWCRADILRNEEGGIAPSSVPADMLGDGLTGGRETAQILT